jgi:nucleoid-associated protein YgaU
VVQRGDTLARIAAAQGVSWRTLWAQNRSAVPNPNLIYPGQRLAL